MPRVFILSRSAAFSRSFAALLFLFLPYLLSPCRVCKLGVGQKEKMRPSSERWARDQASLGRGKLERESVSDRGDYHWEPGWGKETLWRTVTSTSWRSDFWEDHLKFCLNLTLLILGLKSIIYNVNVQYH